MTRVAGERAKGTRQTTWSGLYAVASLSRAVTGFMAIPILVGSLPPHEYAAIVLVAPVWWAGQPLLSLGASEGLSRSVVGRVRSEVNGALVAIAMLVATTTSCLGFAVFAWSDSMLGVGWDHGIAAAMAIAGMQSLFACQLSVMRGTGLVRQATLALFGFAAIPQLVGVAMLLSEPRVAAYFVGYLVGLGIVLIYCSGACVLGAGIRFTSTSVFVMRESCKFGLHATPQALSIQAVDIALRRTVLHVAGIGAVGTLGVAAACGGLVWNFIKAFGQVWAPLVYTKPADEVRAFMQRSLDVGTLATSSGVPLVLLFLPLVEQVLPATYDGPAFTSSAATYLLSAVTGLGLIVASTECLQLRRTTPLAWSSPIAACLTIPSTIAVGMTGHWELGTLAIGLSLYVGTVVLVAGTRSPIGLDYRRYHLAALFTLLAAIAASWSRHGGLSVYYIVTVLSFLIAAALSSRGYRAVRGDLS